MFTLIIHYLHVLMKKVILHDREVYSVKKLAATIGKNICISKVLL